ncbi:MAG: VTT domain-containing protein [Acidimicrobiales bacterium]|nr:VTT domain-containing protein [Acidimicrobiales bacterium]
MLSSLLVASSKPWKPEFWLELAGPSAAYVVAAILFAESGLFFGFFLPGDSLLFLSGFLTSSGAHDYVQTGAGQALAPVVEGMPHILALLPMFFVAAVAGDQVGYLFGRKVGPALFSREDSRLFKQAHVTKAHAFLEKHGPKTIVMARFVPIVRTFAPIVAGVGEMPYRTFVTFNLIGGFLWAVGLTSLGYFLGNVSFVRDHIETAILGVIALSLLPVVIEVVKSRREKRVEANATITEPVD